MLPNELINMKTFVLRMTDKYPFVLGRLPTELNHFPLSENNVVLTLHYAKIMESWQWEGHPSGFYEKLKVDPLLLWNYDPDLMDSF